MHSKMYFTILKGKMDLKEFGETISRLRKR